MRSRSPALVLGLLAVGATGCELVFGLDDYARDPAGAGGGSTVSGSGGGGSGGGGRGGGDGPSSGGGPATTGTSTSVGSSTASGGPAGCQCVPPIPEGWSLVTRTDAALGAPEATCIGAERLAVGTPDAACTCSCGEAPDATCQGARLECFQAIGCTGTAAVLDLGAACTDLGGEFRSCRALPATPSLPPCNPTATPVELDGDAIDLCPASTTFDAACGGDGMCAAVEGEQRTCIRGQGPCPAGWTGQALDAHAPGEVTCDACSCDGPSCTDPGYRAGRDPVFCSGTPVGAACADVTTLFGPSNHATLNAPATLQGECAPDEPVVEAAYAPGVAVSVCCLPPPGD